MKQNRKQFIATAAAATAGALFYKRSFAASPDDDGFTLPPLNYEFSALEPYIDQQTMQIHYEKHHGTYVQKLNEALAEKNVKGKTIEQICKNVSTYSTAVRNNGGGHYNHSMFWQLMAPGGNEMPGSVSEALIAAFSTVDKFRDLFTETALKRFGSGWAWLVRTADGKLAVGSTANQDNPLMDVSDFKGTPILGLDVWEHAYYLKYQNMRSDYIKSWWNVVNWNEVAKRMA